MKNLSFNFAFSMSIKFNVEKQKENKERITNRLFNLLCILSICQ